jgi:hypothetical protein
MKYLNLFILINKYIFHTYFFVTLLILFFLKLNIITYGPDAIDSFMFIIIVFITVLVFLLRKWTIKSPNITKLILLNINSIFMVLMILYYFMEDNFRFV